MRFLQFEYFHLPTFSLIVEALDVVKDIRSCIGMRLISTTINALSFQHAEEALAGGIVGATTNTAHRAGQVVTFQKALILVTSKFTTTVAMQNHRLSRLALPQSHQHGLQHQLPVLATAHRPANDDPGVQINNDTQVQPQSADDSEWSKKQGVVGLFPCFSSPNRTCASQRIRLSIHEWLKAMATSRYHVASLCCISLIIKGLHLFAVS